jgi:hypothetical protein
VIIDRHSLRDSRWWIVISLLTLLVTTVAYFTYAARAIQGPSGGSLPGLVFAAVGTAIIVFAWALTVRKWRRAARVGRAYTWLQGHVYLSLVSYPVILYHAGFRWGGPLTSALMWAFTICYVSGILLLIVQQIVPRRMLAHLPLETIYDQIDRVSRLNLTAADALVESQLAATRALATVPDLGEDEAFSRAATRTPAATTAPAELKSFYDARVRPYLAADLPPADRTGVPAALAALATAAKRSIRRQHPLPTRDEFADLRRKLPTVAGVLDALEGYAEERRQFLLQQRMQRALYLWLLVHVPTAWIMIILLPLHAIMAVRYL